MVSIMRKYNISVFFAIRLLFCDEVDVGTGLFSSNYEIILELELDYIDLILSKKQDISSIISRQSLLHLISLSHHTQHARR